MSADHLAQADIDAKLSSPEFEAFGTKFELSLHLRRFLPDKPDDPRLGVTLRLVTPDTTVRLSVRFEFGPEVDEFTKTFSTVDPQPADTVYDYGCFITHVEILETPDKWFKDGGFTVKVTLTKVGGVKATPGQLIAGSSTPPCPFAVPESSFFSEMRQLLAGTRGCPTDLTLLCPSDGERVQAHSYVLSLRSGVFRALLVASEGGGGGLAAVDRSAVPVCAEVTGPTLRRLLEFVYTDELTPANPEEAQHLLHAADYYELGHLKVICERALYEQLSVDNVAFTLTLAAQHRARALEREAILFAARHVKAVLATEGWKHLSETRPELKDKVILAMATGEVPDEGDGAGAAAQGAGGEGAGGQQQEAGGGAGGSNKRARRR